MKCFNLIAEFLGSLKQKIKESLIFSEEHRLGYDFNSEPNLETFKDTFRIEDTVCSSNSYFSVKDEMDPAYTFENTEEFITKWHILDDSKYIEGEEWFSNFMFKNEIIVLSAIAVAIMG